MNWNLEPMRMLLSLIACLVMVAPAYAANQIMLEDFEGVSTGAIPQSDPTGSGEISEAARTFYGTCGSANGAFIDSNCSSGQCARAYIGGNCNGDSYSEPKWRFDNMISGQTQVYVKFDFRVDSNLGTTYENSEIDEFKTLLITEHTNAGYGAFSDGIPRIQVNLIPSHHGSYLYTVGAGDTSVDAEPYYFTTNTVRIANNLMDNQWHTLEVYVDIGSNYVPVNQPPSNGWMTDSNCDGIVIVREDNTVVLSDVEVPFRFSSGWLTEINSVAFIRHAKTNDAPSGYEGNVYFDNMELWEGPFTSFDSDGMPVLSETPTTATGIISSGVIIGN